MMISTSWPSVRSLKRSIIHSLPFLGQNNKRLKQTNSESLRYHQSESLPLHLPKADGSKEISSCEKREGGNRNEEFKNEMCLGYLRMMDLIAIGLK